MSTSASRPVSRDWGRRNGRYRGFTLSFAGVDVSQAVGKQPNRPAAQGKYARSTIQAFNVRSYDKGRPSQAEFLFSLEVA